MGLREGQVRIPSGCAISGIMSRDGKNISGADIIKSIKIMHDRSNGLGGGFAGYGIYPQYKDLFAFHVFYETQKAKEDAETIFTKSFDIAEMSKIPTRKHPNIINEPLIWRYFVKPRAGILLESQLDEDSFVRNLVMKINSDIEGAFVFSSGKNMGVFKAVGYPEDVGEFYCLDTYKGYLWTAHGRYPTNTPGWWGGAHPFNILDYTIVHNGEISSYDANRRFIEMFDYKCTLLTDTEVITYILDLLVRRHKIPLSEVPKIIAAPFWSKIDKMNDEDKQKMLAYRSVYSSLLITGPFSIIFGFNGGMMALNDRLKLRSMVAAEKGDMLYVASEESAIRVICDNPDRVWAPSGGEPVIGLLNKEVK